KVPTVAGAGKLQPEPGAGAGEGRQLQSFKRLGQSTFCTENLADARFGRPHLASNSPCNLGVIPGAPESSWMKEQPNEISLSSLRHWPSLGSRHRGSATLGSAATYAGQLGAKH